MPVLTAAYYHVVRRPALLAGGATPCERYQPQIPAEMPRDCDVAVSSLTGDVVEELYLAKHGVNSTVVVSMGGRWHSTETSYTATQVAMFFPMLAFAAGMITVLHKVFRTGAVLSWQLQRYQADQFENILWFYAVPVLLLGIGMMTVTQYAL
jgi:hypothetical protein